MSLLLVGSLRPSRSVSYVRGRLFAGSKGAAFIRRTRAANKIRVYDAYLHHKTKMLHEGTPPRSFYTVRTSRLTMYSKIRTSTTA